MFKRYFFTIGFGLLILFAISTGTVTAVINSHNAQPVPSMTPYPEPIATATTGTTPTASPTAAISPTSSPTPQPELPKSTAKPTPPA